MAHVRIPMFPLKLRYRRVYHHIGLSIRLYRPGHLPIIRSDGDPNPYALDDNQPQPPAQQQKKRTVYHLRQNIRPITPPRKLRKDSRLYIRRAKILPIIAQALTRNSATSMMEQVIYPPEQQTAPAPCRNSLRQTPHPLLLPLWVHRDCLGRRTKGQIEPIRPEAKLGC